MEFVHVDGRGGLFDAKSFVGVKQVASGRFCDVRMWIFWISNDDSH